MPSELAKAYEPQDVDWDALSYYQRQFQYVADQRMKCFGFYVSLVFASLVGGVALLSDADAVTTMVFGAAQVWIAVSFALLDYRNRQIIRCCEAGIIALEDRWFSAAGDHELQVFQRVRQLIPGKRFPALATLINDEAALKEAVCTWIRGLRRHSAVFKGLYLMHVIAGAAIMILSAISELAGQGGPNGSDAY